MTDDTTPIDINGGINHVRPILKRSTRLLPVRLTDDDLRDRGRALAQVCDDIASERARHDSIKTELKARLAKLEADRAVLSALIRRGDEERDVEVITVADYARAVAVEIRTDTNDTLRERPLEMSERQPTLPLVIDTVAEPLTPEVEAAAARAEVVHSEAPEVERG